MSQSSIADRRFRIDDFPFLMLKKQFLISRLMLQIRKLWSELCPLTRGLAIFFLLNIAINLAMCLWRGGITPRNSLYYTYQFFLCNGGDDSWGPIRQALAYLDAPGDLSLYSAVYAPRGGFQYPPTSLLLFEPLKHFIDYDLTSDFFLNWMSWWAVIATALIIALVFMWSVRYHLGSAVEDHFIDRVVQVALAIGFTLTFWPIGKSFHLGQIQTWITFLVTVAVWTWITGHKGLSGAAVGLVCAIQPQLSLLLVWGLLRKEWGFVGGLAFTVAVFGVLSLRAYGLSNHVDYLNVLSFISQHGENYIHNQSVNGLLHRLLFTGNSLDWASSPFPPYNRWVHVGTVVSSVLIISMALFWRRGEHGRASLTDLLIAVLSFTMASPVAWQHHYGKMLVMFAVTVPATIGASRLGRSGLAVLIASFVLVSNRITDRWAETPFNFLQSYLFFGAVLLLIHLYRLRHAQQVAVESSAAMTTGATHPT